MTEEGLTIIQSRLIYWEPGSKYVYLIDSSDETASWNNGNRFRLLRRMYEEKMNYSLSYLWSNRDRAVEEWVRRGGGSFDTVIHAQPYQAIASIADVMFIIEKDIQASRKG